MIIYRWFLPVLSVFTPNGRRFLSNDLTAETFKKTVHILTQKNEKLRDVPGNIQIYKLVPLNSAEDIIKETEVVAKVIKPRRSYSLRFINLMTISLMGTSMTSSDEILTKSVDPPI